MAGYNAGSAFISIAPSFRGFNTKVAAYMKSLRPVSVPVEFKASTKPILPPPIKNPVIRPEVDTRSAMAQLSRLESRLDRLARGRFLINVGIAASPLAIPAVAAGAGALGGLAAVGAAGLAGVAGFAAVGQASLERALESQEALKAATEDRTAAVGTLRSAQASLASAVRSASQTQIQAARSIADAERAVADARRAAARSVADAEGALADARESARRSVATAEDALASAREDAARRSVQAQRAIADAQAELVASQDRVRASLEDLHAAREQAKRDLDDLAERTRDNALTIEGAEIGLLEAQQRLAAVEGNAESSALDLRKARLDLAEAEDRLSDVRKQAAEDAAKLAAAEKAGVDGSDVVKSARAQLAAAKADRQAAKEAVAQARRDARVSARDAAETVAAARAQLALARSDAAESVADAQRNLTIAQADAARSVADAERNLGETRADAARSVADAQAQVAQAQAGVAAASAAIAAADQARKDALAGLNPAQQAAIRGVERLKRSWNSFLDATSGPVLGALVVGMDALRASLPALSRFIRPVARGFSDMFGAFGKAAGSKEFQRFARTFGRFAREVLGDAARGVLNLARGFGDLLVAFMPLGSDMSDGIVKLTKRFADWSATLGRSQGFRSFIAYVRETGPLLMSTLAAIGSALISVGKALAPMAAAMLHGLQAFAKWIAATAEAHPWLIRIVAGVALFTAGLSALAKPAAALISVVRILTGGIGAAIKIIKIVVFNLRILWLVLKANPLGMVITIIGLLVAGFITAYKTSDTFREIVDKAWDAIKRAVRSAWEQWIKPALKAMWRFIKEDLWPIIQKLWNDVVKPTFQKIGEAIAWAWNNVIKPLFAAWKAYLENVLFPVLRFLWNSVIKPVFRQIGDFIGSAWRDVIKPIFEALGSFIKDKVAPAFERGVELIGTAWDKLKAAAKKPINFVIETVYNNGIRAGFNKVADFLGLDARLPQMAAIGGRTSLGRNANQHTKNTLISAAGGAGGMGDLVKTIGGKTWDWAKDKFMGPVQGLLDRVGGSPWAQMAAGAGRRLASSALDKLKALFGATEGDTFAGAIGKAGIVMPAGAYSIGMPYLGYQGHYGADYPAATGTPVFSPWPGNIIASYDIPGSNPYNDTPYDSYGRVVKVAHPNGLTTLYAHLSSRIGRTGTIAAGQQIGTVGMNGNATGPHLHFEVLRGTTPTNPAGYGLFDFGGLARTAGLMAKGPMPERVLSPRQTAAFERAMDSGFSGDAADLVASIERQTTELKNTLRQMPRDYRLAEFQGVRR